MRAAVGVLDESGQVVIEEGSWASFETGDAPGPVLAAVVSHLAARGPFAAVGAASFGPVELDRRRTGARGYGHITTTPKAGWAGADVLGPLRTLAPRAAFDTDVNCAAMAEQARSGARNCAYVTVGTGVGVGLVVEGVPVHGVLHPEMGHIRVPRAAEDDAARFAGVCPFHGDCLEGLVTNHAVARRLGFGADVARLPAVADEDPVWALVAGYLAQLCATLTLTLAPQHIVLGGGLMQRKVLFPLVHARLREIVAGYVPLPDDLGSYVMPSPYGDRAGMFGALYAAVHHAHED